MREFSDTIKMIRAASSSDKPYHQAVQDVSRALCGHEVRTPSGGFKVICEALEEAHKKELDDMRRDVTDEAEEAKNLMVAQVVSRYNKQMEAMREECEQKVRAAIGNSQDANRIEHVRKEEYNRGYEDGLKARDVGMWQLEHERRKAVRWLREYDVDNDSYDAFARALGVGQDECIRTRLIHLLDGDEKVRESSSGESYKNGDISQIEQDSLLVLLRDAAKEYKELLDKYLGEPYEAMQSMDDEHMNKLGWMRALDRDGVPICMGDTVRYDEKDVPFVGEPFEVSQITHFSNGSCYISGGWSSVGVKSVQCTHQEPKPDPIEQTIRELTIGNMTEKEAIERLHEIIGS